MAPPDRPDAPPFTLEELTRCREILEAIAADRALLAPVPEAERQTLLVAAGRVSRPARLDVVRLNRERRKHERKEERQQNRQTLAATGIRAARASPVFVAPPKLLPSAESARTVGELTQPRACYVCKAEYTRLHFFYDSMCEACAALNYEKRFQTADLRGRVALVTGGRVKIGFHVALKLLRAGADVIVTTRFPNDAALRFSREPDFADFATRLQVHGLDLRHTPSVELFARWALRNLPRLDFLVNNACQTVRRPPGWHSHLLPTERAVVAELPEAARPLLRDRQALLSAIAPDARARQLGDGSSGDGSGGAALSVWHGGGRPGVGIAGSAELSLVPYDFDDASLGRDVFPEGRLDADQQQVDLRSTNSWRLTLTEVPTPELLEVHLVNAVAPFVLSARLKPLMQAVPSRDKHIVQVSAMEGQFSRRKKTDRHPHTNMAKAGLNMLVRTSAPDYLRDGIHMNAVDTGWVTDEDPAVHAARKIEEHDFEPPLDIVDGAARILDPIFHGLNSGVHVAGLFLKDYQAVDW